MDHKTLVQQQFGPNAAAYAASPVHAKGASLARLVELTRPRAAWRILDVATGAGHTAFAFAPHVARVTASDLTPEMLAAAQALAQQNGLANVDFQEADAENLPFDEAVFDLVTCRIAPHHFPDVDRFTREGARVLKPGGTLAIVDNIAPEDPVAAGFVNRFEKFRDPSHERCLSAGEWAASFQQAGLVLIHAETARKAMRFAAWADNMNASPQTRAGLRNMLEKAPAPARAFLSPEWADDGELIFYLTEGIFLGTKE